MRKWYIYREWLRLHNGRPPFQRRGFFAKPAQILETGPQGLDQITTFHHDLSEYISTHTRDLVHFEHWDTKPPRFSKKPKEESLELEINEDVKSWYKHRFIMRHLFRALYIVIDDQSLSEAAGPDPRPPPEELEGYDLVYWRERNVEREMANCAVLLVKTGNEEHLSSPISFEHLCDAGLALNVNRDDYTGGPEDVETVVRVNLGVAVRFCMGTVAKREASFGGD
ncbi:hypothetical protein IL306_015241 [Fusarium sp. DS 682]|nr:hypothetical protein IL306_015241 [Fusarium sp. DS 682]